MDTWLIVLICSTLAFLVGSGVGYYTRCKDEESE